MSEARRNIQYSIFFSPYTVFNNLTSINMPKPDYGLALHYHKFLGLGMVIMVPPYYPRFCS